MDSIWSEMARHWALRVQALMKGGGWQLAHRPLGLLETWDCRSRRRMPAVSAFAAFALPMCTMKRRMHGGGLQLAALVVAHAVAFVLSASVRGDRAIDM